MSQAPSPSRPAEHATDPRSFAALRHPGYRGFFVTAMLLMMADCIEHVISYWIMYQKFRSPMLGGIAMITHWVPFLFLSVYAGALADRFGAKRLIVGGALLFMLVSVGWGVLFLTDSLQVWHAVLLLTLHGIAGVMVTPAQQIIIHEIVGPAQLQSAVRLTVSARMLGLLVGPALGGVAMQLMGASLAILLNALLYLPTVFWIGRRAYGATAAHAHRVAGGLRAMMATVAEAARDRTILTMTLLAGVASLLVGHAYQAQMPQFTLELLRNRATGGGWHYSALMAADAAGALFAGLVLESRGLLRATPRSAIVLAALWCVAIAGFAMATSYPVAWVLLFVAGFLNLAFSTMAQTLVQLHAPEHIRGRVIGLFSTASLGLRAFSGVTVGIVGGLIGIHWSLALSAMILLAAVLALLPFTLAAPRRA